MDKVLIYGNYDVKINGLLKKKLHKYTIKFLKDEVEVHMASYKRFSFLVERIIRLQYNPDTLTRFFQIKGMGEKMGTDQRQCGLLDRPARKSLSWRNYTLKN